jgi:hypothetical protein
MSEQEKLERRRQNMTIADGIYESMRLLSLNPQDLYEVLIYTFVLLVMNAEEQKTTEEAAKTFHDDFIEQCNQFRSEQRKNLQ